MPLINYVTVYRLGNCSCLSRMNACSVINVAVDKGKLQVRAFVHTYHIILRSNDIIIARYSIYIIASAVPIIKCASTFR